MPPSFSKDHVIGIGKPAHQAAAALEGIPGARIAGLLLTRIFGWSPENPKGIPSLSPGLTA
jgi:hypothetical protein